MGLPHEDLLLTDGDDLAADDFSPNCRADAPVLRAGLPPKAVSGDGLDGSPCTGIVMRRPPRRMFASNERPCATEQVITLPIEKSLNFEPLVAR